MKFEKFLKDVGTHGEIITRDNGDNWLVCGGVAMKVPKGVNNLLGTTNKDTTPIFTALMNVDTKDDTLVLKEAILKDPEGKAGDIIRVFETELGERVGIYNADFGLLEKKDLLTYLAIDIPAEYDGDTVIEDETTVNFIVVLDRKTYETIGFITGIKNI